MEEKKSKITKKTVFTVTSAAVLVFVLIFSILSFVIKDQNEDNMINSGVDFSDVSDESAASSMDETSVFDDSSDMSDVFSESSFDISEISDFSDISEISDVIDEITHGWIINEFGYTYVYNGCGYVQFNYKSSALQRYVNTLNNFVATLPENTRVFSITVPVSTTFADIPREIYTADNFYNQAQTTFVSTVSSLTDERIKHIPIVDLLEREYDNGEYVYFRTDKNWTSDGAYIAYAEFCKNAGFTAHPITSFAKSSMDGYLGSFYNATKLNAMASNPDTFTYYLPLRDVRSTLTVYDENRVYENYTVCGNNASIAFPSYVFLGREAERYEIHTTASGGSLILIGDESIYPCVPFLMSHYSRIDVIDPSRFKTSFTEFFENRSYDDCIVMCYSINSISGDFVPTFNYLTGAVTDE